MTDRMQLNDRDLAALRTLGEFETSADGTTATITGEMRIEAVRVAEDRLQLTIGFPNDDFVILLSRAKTLEQLGILDES